uniref:Putative addiction module component, TIGR02574 family n=1 Tax=Candidatus Kentrum sp. DK TaxID=2126562 RepID=A0A450TJJ9_9GAMM|nr:MAG: putative addiction module component, TIGR02574 family [Candidatus Kentron sp. DK]
MTDEPIHKDKGLPSSKTARACLKTGRSYKKVDIWLLIIQTSYKNIGRAYIFIDNWLLFIQTAYYFPRKPFQRRRMGPERARRHLPLTGLPSEIAFLILVPTRLNGNRETEKRRTYMINASELISVAESLPLEMKTELIDRLINSLNPSREEIDALWAQEAERRVEELESGKVEAIPGEEVFREIWNRLSA